MCFFDWCCFDPDCPKYKRFVISRMMHWGGFYRVRYRLPVLRRAVVEDLDEAGIPTLWAIGVNDPVGPHRFMFVRFHRFANGQIFLEYQRYDNAGWRPVYVME